MPKSRNSGNKVLTQNWYKPELPSLIFTKFCLNVTMLLTKRHKKMTGHQGSIRTTVKYDFFVRFLEKGYITYLPFLIHDMF